MTGLNVSSDHILEIACLITEGDLRLVAEGPSIVIHQPDTVLEAMGDWCTEHHGKSGLTEAVRKSKISVEKAQEVVLTFVEEHTPAGVCCLAGNSVSMDKRFLDEHMPQLAAHLHYRIVDVSTVKELCQCPFILPSLLFSNPKPQRRWYPQDFEGAPPKKLSHRAMDDIWESVMELKYYRNSVFK